MKMCPCRKPLHYPNRFVQALVDKLIEEKGEFLEVRCHGKVYRVSRHYIALHGLRAIDLEALADAGTIERVLLTKVEA